MPYQDKEGRWHEGTFDAEWQPWGPVGFTNEQDDGRLLTDYTASVDGRWPNNVTLGPALNAVSLSAAAGTAANTNSFCLSGAMNATVFLYAARGTKWGKVALGAMTLSSDGTEGAMAERVTQMFYVKNAAGTEQIVACMAATAMRVISVVGAGATDTDAAATSGTIARYVGNATPANVIALVGRLAPSIENVVGTIELTGSNSMDTTPTVRATISGETFTFTGFTLDGPFWMVETTNGPYYLDETFNQFRPLIDEIDVNASHGLQAQKWYPVGTLHPLARGLRFSDNLLRGWSIGPEVQLQNQGLFQGRPATALAASERWLYGVLHNERTGDRFLWAACPATYEDGHNGLLSYYTIGKLSNACEAMLYTGTQGGRANPTIVYGASSNMGWFFEGLDNIMPNDPAYRFVTSGTWYGTELRRYPNLYKKVEYIDVDHSGITAARTLTVSLGTDGTTARQFGAVVNNQGRDGWTRVKVPQGQEMVGIRVKPEVAWSTNSSSASPAITQKIRVHGKLLTPAMRWEGAGV